MATIRRRTIHLPDHITVTILRLPDGCTADVLRQMVSASLYVLAGPTSDADTGTSYGAYVGVSAALEQRVARCGVSLRQWAFRQGALRPDTVLLVNRVGRPIDPNALLLIEASLARAISTHYTILNTRTSAPTASRAATRHQRLWAQHMSHRLAGLVLGHVFHPHPRGAAGGSTREQLIRLVLDANRPMNVNDLLIAARQAGMVVPGRTPCQRTRRDITTRERIGATGCPRLLRTHIGGRAVVYPAGAMSLRQARDAYRATHPDARPAPCRRTRRR